jgi:hypothetical protein
MQILAEQTGRAEVEDGIHAYPVKKECRRVSSSCVLSESLQGRESRQELSLRDHHIPFVISLYSSPHFHVFYDGKPILSYPIL